jgi:threonine dehydratase
MHGHFTNEGTQLLLPDSSDRTSAEIQMSCLFTLDDIESALPIVRTAVPPTPQYAWPRLAARTGAEVFVKHENHTPIGAFKVRGGLVYMDRLRRQQPQVPGVVSATRGNHGQSLAFAARGAGIAATIVVPHANSAEKNAAMRAFGAELIEQGRDFDEAKQYAAALARQRGYAFAPAFHRDLVIGVATYAYEFFAAVSDLDTVYVPIGLGSGICGVIGVRDALGRATRIVGVVAQNANAYARSFAANEVVTTETANTFADGLAVRVPDATALAVIRGGADRIVEVSEGELVEAIGIYFSDTHTLAEGAGAAPLAALIKERARMYGRRVGLIMTGQNIDRAAMCDILAGRVPDWSAR